MFTLRKPESEAKYQARKRTDECPLCTAPVVEEWKYWRLIRNDYPYDLVAEKHDLLVLKEHSDIITRNAWIELNESKYIFEFAPYEYHCVIENLPVRQSVPGHYHLHLLRYKK